MIIERVTSRYVGRFFETICLDGISVYYSAKPSKQVIETRSRSRHFRAVSPYALFVSLNASRRGTYQKSQARFQRRIEFTSTGTEGIRVRNVHASQKVLSPGKISARLESKLNKTMQTKTDVINENKKENRHRRKKIRLNFRYAF